MAIHLLKRQFGDYRKGLPLYYVLVVPFVLQILLAVSLTGYLSLRNGQKAVNDVAAQLRSEISARIQDRLHRYLYTSHLINAINVDAVEIGLLDLQDLPTLQRYFLQQAEEFALVDFIFFGSAQGEFVGGGWPQGRSHSMQVAEVTQADPQVLKFFDSDRFGHNLQLARSSPNFEVRQRPWYVAAEQARQPVWSEVFTYHAFPTMAVSASAPVYDRQGNLLGVFSNNFFLTQISDFLKSLDIGRTGQAFIIERSGLLVASSTLAQPFEVNQGITQRINATQSSDKLLRTTSQYLQSYFTDLSQIRQSEQLSFRWNGERQFLQVMPFGDDQGLDWLIVVVVPEADFMGQIQANRRVTILLCLGALILAILIGFLTSRWVTQPVLKLIRASQSLADGDLEQQVNVKGIHELEVLGSSFNQMAQQLKTAFDALAATNESLEARVEQRTLELKAAMTTAEAANHAKSEFLAHMSHELRSPLNAILGFSQLLTRTAANSACITELEIIRHSGEHLLALINDVLEMSKIEAGHASLEATCFNLTDLLASLKEMLALRAKSKGLELTFICAARVPHYLQTDEKKLRQVLLNLLSNAVKFTETGCVTLRVTAEAMALSPPEMTDLKRSPHMLMFEVEDTGPGIAPDELEHVFDAFVQTRVGQSSSGGTGLGLFISQKFVKLMGGTLRVDSVVGQGSCFHFEIPVNSVVAAEVSRPASRHRVVALAPGQPLYRILIVDDRWVNRHLMVKLLAPLGFDLKEAQNGEEAIALWQTWRPHLIWMDMKMPIMDGYAATQHIKALPQGQATVIIALTASAFDEERSLILSLGCDDFVHKPFQEAVIFEKMAQHLNLQYIYDGSEKNSDNSNKDVVIPQAELSDLLGMKDEWIRQLYQAAERVDNAAILQLTAQIPAAKADLAIALQGWVENFRCDKIIHLIEQFNERYSE